MSQLFDLTGRHALVTGASGGLGRHFAETLSRAGAQVPVAARRGDALADTVAGIEAAGGQAQAVKLDVTDPSSIEAALDAAQARFGAVTVLINNAGIAEAKLARDLERSSWDRMLDTNLTGTWQVAQAVAKRLIAAGSSGSIVNIASIGGLRQHAAGMAYGVTKAGIVQLTKVLALEWAEHDIRVNAIAPGIFRTEMTAASLDSDKGKEVLSHIPQGRIGEMSDLEGPCLLLASDASAFMTGSVVVVDGGHMVSSL